jgi:hypothetical protein
MKIDQAKPKCLDCGEPIVGRADKKFCDDSCRSNFHNKTREDSVDLIRNVNYKLRKNRKILEELNPKGKSKTSRSALLKRGFDFSYVTSYYTTKANKTYYFVYEQGYLELDKDEFALVVKLESIE